MGTKSNVEDSHFKDPSKSVFERGQKPEHGQKLVHDIFAGHDAEKKAYKDQHKDAKDPQKLEENAEAAATKRELGKLNEKFKQHLPEGSQIVGHGHGKSGDYLFVKPSKDSKDVYAINPDTGKPEAHYRVEDKKWVQVGKNPDGGEKKTYPGGSQVITDKEGHVTKVTDVNSKGQKTTEEFKWDHGKLTDYKDKGGQQWHSNDGGKTFTGPHNEKMSVSANEKGEITKTDLSKHTQTVERRDGSEVTTDDKKRITQIKDGAGNETKLHYAGDSKTVDSYEKNGEVWTMKNGKDWTAPGRQPYEGALKVDPDGTVTWTSKTETQVNKRDGSKSIEYADKSHTDLDATGRVTHVRDAKGKTEDFQYDDKGIKRYKDSDNHVWNRGDTLKPPKAENEWVNEKGELAKGTVEVSRDGALIKTGADHVVTTHTRDGKDHQGKAPDNRTLENGVKSTYVDGKLTEVTSPAGNRTYEYGDQKTGDPNAGGLRKIQINEHDYFAYNPEKKTWAHHAQGKETELRGSPYTTEQNGDLNYKDSKTGWTTTLHANGGHFDRDEQARVRNVAHAKGARTEFDYSKNAEHPSVKLPDGTRWDWDSNYEDYRSNTPGSFQRHPKPFTSITMDRQGNVVCQVKGGGRATYKANGDVEE
jgi:hypothetical protein